MTDDPAGNAAYGQVKKVAYQVQISREMALDYGLIEPTDEDRARWAKAQAEHERWRRSFRGRRAWLRSWWAEHRPTLHFGPCEVDYDD